MYIYVFDYGYNGIYEIAVEKEDENKELEDIVSQYGLNFDDCYFMTSQIKLEIETLNKE